MENFFENLENSVITYWRYILLAAAILLLWYFGLLYGIIKGLIPLFAVIALGWVAWKIWIHYIRQDFISGIDFVLLEIIPPRDVVRNPKAMELFITNALYQFSYKGGKEEYWQGAVWFWFSLEIASIDGQVHFYIRTPTRLKHLIETQMYAQFPQAQVRVAEDYTLAVDEISPESEWNAWGCEFALKKPEAYPIRTYIDYGLDKDPDEELKVDPISPIIELFGALQKGEQAWLQTVITPSKVQYKTKGTWFGYHDWVIEAREELLKLLRPFTSHKEVKEAHEIGIGRSRIEIRVPTFLDRAVKAMNAKTSKLGFDTGIRLVYVAKKEIYPPGTRTNASRDIRLILRQFDAPDVNGFERINSAQGDRYSGVFPASKETVMLLADRMVHEYRERAFFHLPLRHHIFSQHYWDWPIPNVFTLSSFIKAYVHHHTFVLNTEEIATLWHFPGQILKVPTLERIESREASPPTNLPT